MAGNHLARWQIDMGHKPMALMDVNGSTLKIIHVQNGWKPTSQAEKMLMFRKRFPTTTLDETSYL